MLQASVNGRSFEVEKDDQQMTINGKMLNWDISRVGDGCFHILHNNKSYRAEVTKSDPSSKTITVRINNRLYTVSLKDKFDLLLEKMGMSGTTAGKINQIKAPMPGLIIDLKIKDGDTVAAGDPLLILEAMKMENIIKSSASATVKSVKVKKGDSVEKGQILIEF